MADETEKETKMTEKEGKDEIWYRVRPYHNTNFNAATGEFEIMVEMPGVPKDQVSIKLLPELFVLSGKREHTEYTMTEYFPYLADVDSINAEYDHGLLTVTGKFKDRLEDAVEITL